MVAADSGMIVVAIIGLVVGLVATVLASKASRSRALATSYGAAAASVAWAVPAAIQSNVIEGMGAIPYAVAAGVIFWFLFVPAASSVAILERRRYVARRDSS